MTAGSTLSRLSPVFADIRSTLAGSISKVRCTSSRHFSVSATARSTLLRIGMISRLASNARKKFDTCVRSASAGVRAAGRAMGWAPSVPECLARRR